MSEDNIKVTTPDGKTYSFQLGSITRCPHHFIRLGLKVECTKCGVGYDDPEQKFPIEEANKYFGSLGEAPINQVGNNGDNN